MWHLNYGSVKLLKSKEASDLKSRLSRGNRRHKGPGMDSKGRGEFQDRKEPAWLQRDKLRDEWKERQEPFVSHGRSLDLIKGNGKCWYLGSREGHNLMCMWGGRGMK